VGSARRRGRWGTPTLALPTSVPRLTLAIRACLFKALPGTKPARSGYLPSSSLACSVSCGVDSDEGGPGWSQPLNATRMLSGGYEPLDPGGRNGQGPGLAGRSPRGSCAPLHCRSGQNHPGTQKPPSENASTPPAFPDSRLIALAPLNACAKIIFQTLIVTWWS